MAATNPPQFHNPARLFDLEDAFDDGDDDHDHDFKFSSDAIRQEMAKNLSTWSNDANVDDEQGPSFDNPRLYHEQDLSVSTLDINGEQRSSPPPHTPDDEANPTQFVQISLSRSGSDVMKETDIEEPAQEVKQSQVDDNASALTAKENPHPYPTVIIDASKPPSHRVTISSDLNKTEDGNVGSTSSSPPPSSPPRSSSEDGSEHSSDLQSSQSLPPTPLNTKQSVSQAASTSALPPSPITPVVAAPASSTSNTSATLAPPSPKPGHRQTRSLGPSTFEKVRSRTRPSFLPPKSRQEDDKHMAEWQALMKQSRTIGELLIYHGFSRI